MDIGAAEAFQLEGCGQFIFVPTEISLFLMGAKNEYDVRKKLNERCGSRARPVMECKPGETV